LALVSVGILFWFVFFFPISSQRDSRLPVSSPCPGPPFPCPRTPNRDGHSKSFPAPPLLTVVNAPPFIFCRQIGFSSLLFACCQHPSFLENQPAIPPPVPCSCGFVVFAALSFKQGCGLCLSFAAFFEVMMNDQVRQSLFFAPPFFFPRSFQAMAFSLFPLVGPTSVTSNYSFTGVALLSFLSCCLCFFAPKVSLVSAAPLTFFSVRCFPSCLKRLFFLALASQPSWLF